MGQKTKHRKSRLGCQNCKNRRVKCDERKPCGNCKRRGEICNTSESDTRHRMNLPLTNEDWALDMYLMFYYVTNTAETLSLHRELQNAFRINVSEMGRQHPYLYSAIVATAALHLHVLQPSGKPTTSKYWIAYKKHQVSALSNLQREMQVVSEDNCNAVYMCAALLAFFTLKEFSLEEGAAVASATVTPSGEVDKATLCAIIAGNLKMVLGVKAAVQGARIVPTLSCSMLSVFARHVVCMVPDSFLLSESVSMAFSRLQSALIGDTNVSQASQEGLQTTLALLRGLYREVGWTLATSTLEVDQMFKFYGTIPWEYIMLVQEGNDYAILIFAYFALLSCAIKSTWCLDNNFARVALDYCRRLVSPRLLYLLEWPEHQYANDMIDFKWNC